MFLLAGYYVSLFILDNKFMRTSFKNESFLFIIKKLNIICYNISFIFLLFIFKICRPLEIEPSSFILRMLFFAVFKEKYNFF